MARTPQTDADQIELAAERIAGRTLCVRHLWVPEQLRTHRGRVHVALVLALLADERCRTLVVAGPDERGVLVHERRLDDPGDQRPDDLLPSSFYRIEADTSEFWDIWGVAWRGGTSFPPGSCC